MLWKIQVALDTLLYNTISYNGKTIPVYDSIPSSSEFPYIRYGEDTAVPWDTKQTYGKDMTHTLHIFSGQGWKQETKEIMALIEQQLRESVNVDGHDVVIQEIENQEVLNDDNNITHGVMRIRLRIEE